MRERDGRGYESGLAASMKIYNCYFNKKHFIPTALVLLPFCFCYDFATTSNNYDDANNKSNHHDNKYLLKFNNDRG